MARNAVLCRIDRIASCTWFELHPVAELTVSRVLDPSTVLFLCRGNGNAERWRFHWDIHKARDCHANQSSWKDNAVNGFTKRKIPCHSCRFVHDVIHVETFFNRTQGHSENKCQQLKPNVNICEWTRVGQSTFLSQNSRPNDNDGIFRLASWHDMLMTPCSCVASPKNRLKMTL